ncbi:MAG: hypothetical protein R3270_06140, partial [Gammaproteobacteria bacterium]|nr:hypothetical protein [Gammaproteobacteria bacterium]
AAFASFQQLYAAGVTPETVDTGDATTDALYGAIYPLFQGADAATIGAQNLAVAWSFKTQSIGASLNSVEGMATAQDSGFAPIPKNGVDYSNGIATTADLNQQLQGKSDVYVGIIELPYFHDAENPLSGFWQADGAECVMALPSTPTSTTGACPMPEVSTMLRVPVLLTVPNANSATAGAIAGVAIFEHGITRNRSDMLAIADAMADAGRATISIDIALHGITDTTSPLYASPDNPLYQGAAQASGDATLVEGLTEATFNLDADGDGEIDSSGAHFINLASLLTTRDNMRQTVSNLVYLAKTIPTMDYNAALDGGASGADFTGLPIGFVGQSLGAINGTTFLGVNADANAGVVNVPGGVLTQLLTNSNTFAPVINAGLEQNGVIAGTRFYEEFLRNAQTVVDSGDPINYAAAANGSHPVLMHEVIGGSTSQPDQVVPNSATEALAAAMGLAQVGPGLYTGTEVDALVKFTAGDHGSLLDPTASLSVTQEMQTQAASFIGSNGQQLPVGSVDATVIDQP